MVALLHSQNRIVQNLRMVEGQRRQGRDREPAGIGGIVAAFDCSLLNKSVEGNRDDATPRVTVNGRKRDPNSPPSKALYVKDLPVKNRVSKTCLDTNSAYC